MVIDDRLKLFHGMISCNYPVYLWQYDTDFNLIYTNCITDVLPGEMTTTLGFHDLMLEEAKIGVRTPFILSNSFGLLWLAGLEYQGQQLHRFHLIGPAFTGANSHLLMRKKLDSYGFSLRLYQQVLTLLENVPVIPYATLCQYGSMLHYCLTGEQIGAEQIHTLSDASFDDEEELSAIEAEHPGVYLAEQQLLQAFREGNPDYLKAIGKSLTVSNGVRMHLGDPLRESKNSNFVLLTLCSRAAMEGGLSPAVAYTLCDYYAERIERCVDAAQSNKISRQLMEDFIMRVREHHQEEGRSPAIQDVCGYISMHLSEPLPLHELASRAGYADYYFSRKFHRETGIPVSEYICRKRIDAACQLLRIGRWKIEDIMERCGFASKSTFHASFQRIVGMTPSAYQRKCE